MGSSLGQRIVFYRKKAGISQKELADAIGMSSTALSYYETDKREPNITILLRLAKKLNITGDTLLNAEPIPDMMIATNSDEYPLLRIFRGLNNLGRERLLEYAAALDGLPLYVNPTELSKAVVVNSAAVAGRTKKR